MSKSIEEPANEPAAGHNSVIAKLRRLPIIKSILALALSLAPLWKSLYGLVEAVHNADFVLGIREHPRISQDYFRDLRYKIDRLARTTKSAHGRPFSREAP